MPKHTVLYIKNMVCNRCIKVVNDELIKIKIDIKDIELGKVYLNTPVTDETLEKIKHILSDNGFELITDKKSILIDRIKTLIVEKVHHSDDTPEYINSSLYISKEIGYDYSYLSKLFSSAEGITIEKFIILQKIEKAKELLTYNQLSLNEISYKLGYSSVQHLSGQFKKITGQSPSLFRKNNSNNRKPLDKV
jgi:AraC-like DNA-binding protein